MILETHSSSRTRSKLPLAELLLKCFCLRSISGHSLEVTAGTKEGKRTNGQTPKSRRISLTGSPFLDTE